MTKKNSTAIVFPDINQVEVRDVALPPRGDWDVRVELEASAISIGTEKWALIGKRPAGDVTFPCIPGYLSVGIITASGALATEQWPVGARINFLAAELPNGYGGNWMCGHLSPAVVSVDPTKLRAWNEMPYVEIVPDNLSAEAAGLAGLAAVACRGIDMAQPERGSKVLIVGQGMIGHAAAQICRLLGAQTMTADIADQRVQFSAQYAADRAVNSRTEDLSVAVGDWTEGRGADMIIDTTGSAEMLNVEVLLLREHGKLVLQGWYPPPSSVNFHLLQSRFAQIFCPCGHSGDAVRRCMDWMAEGRLNLTPLITHRFPPSEAVAAYDMILHHPDQAMGIVFDWSRA